MNIFIQFLIKALHTPLPFQWKLLADTVTLILSPNDVWASCSLISLDPSQALGIDNLDPRVFMIAIALSAFPPEPSYIRKWEIAHVIIISEKTSDCNHIAKCVHDSYGNNTCY